MYKYYVCYFHSISSTCFECLIFFYKKSRTKMRKGCEKKFYGILQFLFNIYIYESSKVFSNNFVFHYLLLSIKLEGRF